jgi:malate permease and related proteins
MQNIILLVLCLGIGMGLRASGKVPENAHATLNAFIIYVAFPALILRQVHGVHVGMDTIYSVMMPWLLFTTGAAVFWLISRWLRLSPGTTGALMLTGGLGNTSFIGLPMIEAFFGTGGIATGILIDTLGTYLVLSTLGITVACIYSSGAPNARAIALRVLTFPPLIAVLAAAIMMDVQYPRWTDEILGRLGNTLAPLALVSVGLQLRLKAFQGNWSALALGLGYKLIVAPALLAVVYFVLIRGSAAANSQVTVFEAAMGPQIGGAIVATQYGLNPSFVTVMVGAGTLLAFMTLPCWWAVLTSF